MTRAASTQPTHTAGQGGGRRSGLGWRSSRWARAARLWPVPVVCVLAGGPWLTDAYSLTVLSRIMAVGLLAASVAVLTGTAGLPTLGQVAPYAVGAYTTGLLAKAGHATAPTQLAVAAAAAAGFSLLAGVAVVRTRGVVCLMVTLAVGVLVATAAEQWRSFTGGGDGLIGIPAAQPWPGAPALVDERHLYWYTLTVAAAAVAATAAVLRSPAGTLLRGCRDHETRMRASGHRIGGYLLAAYTAAGALAGIGGHLLVTTQRYVSPADVGFGVAAMVLLAVVVGGATSLPGALTATALVMGVQDWAAVTVAGHGPLILGLLFAAAVFALPPQGLAGILPALTHHLTDTIRTRRREAR